MYEYVNKLSTATSSVFWSSCNLIALYFFCQLDNGFYSRQKVHTVVILFVLVWQGEDEGGLRVCYYPHIKPNTPSIWLCVDGCIVYIGYSLIIPMNMNMQTQIIISSYCVVPVKCNLQ